MFVVSGFVSGGTIVDSVHVTAESAFTRLDVGHSEHAFSCGQVHFVWRSTDAMGSESVATETPIIDDYHIDKNGRVWENADIIEQKAFDEQMRERSDKRRRP